MLRIECISSQAVQHESPPTCLTGCLLQVYQEISGLVISTLDGFCCSILAYGQTGSGKTYTIEGELLHPLS